MRYQVGESVILLDTEFKPAVNAVVKDVNTEATTYLVEYQLPNQSEPETIWVLQERLNTALDFIANSK
jgi:hypothetical protein